MDLVQIFSNFGFPALAFFMMYILVTKTIRRNTEAIEKLKDAILILQEKIENLKK